MRRAPSALYAQRQQGAAIVTALLVVAMAAILVSGLLWRQQVQIRRIENQRLHDQAQWTVLSAIDWTRFILHAQADVTPVDYLGGEWAVPIAPTRVADVLGHDDADTELADTTYLSGSIEDAQAHYNLRNLVWAPTPGALQINPSQLRHFQRLLQLLGLDTELATPVAQYLRTTLLGQATRFQGAPTSASSVVGAAAAPAGDGTETNRPGLAEGDDEAAGRPLPLLDLDGLLDLPGITPAIVARLRPFVTLLPQPSAVNVNTAPPEVLAAMIPGLNLDQAQTLVSSRDKTYFINVGDMSNRLGGQLALQADNSQLDVRSCFFIVHGQVDHDRAHVQRDTLLYRDYLTHATRIVSTRDIY